MNRAQTLKKHNTLVDFIKAHKGRNNTVTTKEIVAYMESKGYKMPSTSVTPMLRKLMFERNLPICFVSKGGYYWAKSKSDILPVIEDMRARIDGFQAHINHLNNFILD